MGLTALQARRCHGVDDIMSSWRTTVLRAWGRRRDNGVVSSGRTMVLRAQDWHGVHDIRA
jgi:hypothetical protein